MKRVVGIVLLAVAVALAGGKVRDGLFARLRAADPPRVKAPMGAVGAAASGAAKTITVVELGPYRSDPFEPLIPSRRPLLQPSKTDQPPAGPSGMEPEVPALPPLPDGIIPPPPASSSSPRTPATTPTGEAVRTPAPGQAAGRPPGTPLPTAPAEPPGPVVRTVVLGPAGIMVVLVVDGRAYTVARGEKAGGWVLERVTENSLHLREEATGRQVVVRIIPQKP